MDSYADFAAVILAGGKSTRYNGINKAFIEINGKRIIDIQLEILKSLFTEIIIVTNLKQDFESYTNIKIISDNYIDSGPLGGIEAALQEADKENIFVISCDMPFISQSMIKIVIDEFLLKGPDIIISKTNAYRQPLFGVYSTKIKNNLEIFLQTENKRSIMDFLSTSNYACIQFEDSKDTQLNFFNINSPHELNELNHLISTT